MEEIKKTKKPNHWFNMWEGTKSFSIMMGLLFFNLGKWMFHFTMFVGELFNDSFKDANKKSKKSKRRVKT